MSQTIDSKVVEMKFDNSQFESNVKVSIDTLADLKNALNMDGVSDSLSDITKAAQGVDISSVGEGVDEVSLKFSALEVMATTVLANITNSCVNAAKSMVSSVTGMIFEGGWARAANIEQAEFRLEGLGMDVDEVMSNANEAVKGTAYGLDEAAKAASVFGASGVEAGEDMTSTLRAVAGVAAMTGDDYTSIANIFETVAGNGKLMTVTMRQLETRGLNVAATLGDVLGYTETEIREMVSAGEIDFETFSNAMDEAFGEHAKDANKTFSGALSNMKAALSRFGADVCTPLRENLRDVFNGLTPVIDNIHEAATPAINGLSDLFSALASKILDFLGIFDGTGMSSFFEFIGNGIEKFATAINNFDVSNFVNKFKMADSTVDNLKNTFQGFVSFLDIVRQAFGFVINVAGELLTFLAPVGRAITNVTGTLGSLITRFDEWIKENEVFSTASEKVIGALEKVKEGFSNFRERVAEKFNLSSFDELGGALDKVKDKLSPVTEALKQFKETIGSACKSAWASVKETLSPITDKFKEFGNSIKTSFQNFKSNGNGTFGSFLLTIGDVFTNGLAAVIENVGNGISKFIQALGNFDFSGITGLLSSIGISEIWINLGKISDSFKNMFSSFTSGNGEKANSILNELKGILSQYQKELRAATLIMIAAAIAILAGALVEISNIEEGRLASSLGGLGTLFGELVGATFLINKINFTSSIKAMSSLVIMTKAIKNLAECCVEIGQLDWNGIAKGLTGVGGLFGELYAFLYGTNSLVKVSGKGFSSYNMFGLATSIVILSAAIKILQSAVTTFAGLSWNELAKGLTGVGGLLAEIFGFLAGASSLVKVSGSSYNMIGLATSIVILAAGIKILQSAVTTLAGLSWNELAKGLVGVGALITELIVFIEAVSALEKTEKSYNLIAVASSIVILATGIKILQSAVTQLSGLSWNELAKGLSGVGGLLAEVALFLVAVNSLVKVSTEGASSYNLIGLASSIVILAAGIKILQSAVIKFSGLSWEEMAKGLLTLAGVLTEVVLAFKFMNTGESGILKTASSMLVLAVAADAFAPAMILLGSLSWAGIAKGLITLAGAFTIMGVAGFALSGLSGVIVVLSASLLMIGVAADLLAGALVLAGAGLINISAGLSAFGAAMALSGTEIVAGISAIILGIVNLVPEIINGFIDGVLSVWDTITNFIIEVVHMLIDVIKSTVPELVDGLLEVILEVCKSLAEYAPQIVDSLLVLVEGVVDALIERMPDIVAKLKELVSSIFNAIFEDMDTKGLLELVVSVGLLAYIISKISDMNISLGSAAKTIAELGVLIAELAGVLALVGQLTRIPGLEDGIDRAADLLEGVGNAIGSLIGGLIGGVMTGIADDLPQIADDLSDFMERLQPFIEGASQIDSGIAGSIASLAGAILAITAAEVIEGIASWFTGGSSIVKFGQELAQFGPYFAIYAASISGIDTDAIEASSAAAESIAAFAKSIPNEGGVLACLVGDNSLEQFGKELATFGPYFAIYAASVSGINPDTITASAAAAQSLADFAKSIGNEGGLWAKIAGDNSLKDFGKELADFGPNFAAYANSISGINTDAVTASAAAAQTLADFAKSIGNEGGLWAKIAGDNSLKDFGKELADFGPNFATYANSISGINTDAVTASSAAAETIATFAKEIPNEGGLLSALVGDNSLKDFGKELVDFAPNFVTYASTISEIDESAIGASDTLVNILTALTGVDIPTEGGVISWITGTQMSFSDLGEQLPDLADGISEFASIAAESNMSEETASKAQAFADILDALTSVDLPTEGGVINWIKGTEMSLSDFGDQLPGLAESISEFAAAASAENMTEETVSKAKSFVDILDALTSVDLPTEGGVFNWIKGTEMSLSDFGDQLPGLAESISEFVEASSDVKEEDANKAQSIANILSTLCSVDLPTEGGIFSWFTGNSMSLSDLSKELKKFMPDFKEFTDKAAEIDEGAINGAQTVVDILTKLTGITLPSEGGIISFFKGNDTSLSVFGDELPQLADDIYSFGEKAKNISSDTKNKIDDVVEILNTFAEMETPSTGNKQMSLAEFGNDLVSFAPNMESFLSTISDIDAGSVSTSIIDTINEISEQLSELPDISNTSTFGKDLVSFGGDLEDFCKCKIDSTKIASVIASISDLIDLLSDVTAADTSGISSFASDIEELGQIGMSGFIASIDNAASDVLTSINNILKNVLSTISNKNGDFRSSGATLMTNLVDGVNSRSGSLPSAFSSSLSSAVSSVRNYYNSFYSAGQYLATGFANGISANTYQAEAKASAMANAANKAAQRTLAEKSPSKVGFKTGDYYGIGFVNGIANNIRKAFDVGTDLAESSITGLSSAISMINDFVDGGMDINPTITPVLDLTNVRSGLDSMNGMFNQSRSLAFAADNANFIADAMNRRNIQNDQMGDVLRAIKDLNKHMTNLSGDTYNLNGITYDDGSNIADAVGTLVHAAKIGRRA